jgi:hypothetical protein
MQPVGDFRDVSYRHARAQIIDVRNQSTMLLVELLVTDGKCLAPYQRQSHLSRFEPRDRSWSFPAHPGKLGPPIIRRSTLMPHRLHDDDIGRVPQNANNSHSTRRPQYLEIVPSVRLSPAALRNAVKSGFAKTWVLEGRTSAEKQKVFVDDFVYVPSWHHAEWLIRSNSHRLYYLSRYPYRFSARSH